MGGAEARKIYQRLVRDFSDQRDEASTARSRLGPSQATGDLVVRQAPRDEGQNLELALGELGVGPRAQVLGQDGEAVDVLHRHDRVFEPALLPGLSGALLALDPMLKAP